MANLEGLPCVINNEVHDLRQQPVSFKKLGLQCQQEKSWLWLRQFKSARLEEKNMATVFMYQKAVILMNFLPLYRNTKNSERLPALCSPNQENAIKCCFPMTLPRHTQVHTTDTITKIWTASVATCNLQSQTRTIKLSPV